MRQRKTDMEEEREIIYYMLNTRDFQGQESQLILLNDSFIESRVYMYKVAILTESKLIENKILFKLFHRGNISSSRYHTMFKVHLQMWVVYNVAKDGRH